MAVELRAPNTHLYPGLRGTVGPGEPLRWSPKTRELPCVVEFSDGRTAPAWLERFAEDVCLRADVDCVSYAMALDGPTASVAPYEDAALRGAME